MSSGLNSTERSTLFVPHIRTTCINPILAINGIILSNITLSSLKSCPFLDNRPNIRITITARAMIVQNHVHKRVALLSHAVCGPGGGGPYRPLFNSFMIAVWIVADGRSSLLKLVAANDY